jgi:hypothetical protein
MLQVDAVRLLLVNVTAREFLSTSLELLLAHTVPTLRAVRNMLLSTATYAYQGHGRVARGHRHIARGSKTPFKERRHG